MPRKTKRKRSKRKTAIKRPSRRKSYKRRTPKRKTPKRKSSSRKRKQRVKYIPVYLPYLERKQPHTPTHHPPKPHLTWEERQKIAHLGPFHAGVSTVEEHRKLHTCVKSEFNEALTCAELKAVELFHELGVDSLLIEVKSLMGRMLLSKVVHR